MGNRRRCYAFLIKWLSNYWLLGITIILLSINICFSVGHSVIIDDKNIVLVFVGILATFIVVSNYAQVKHIEDRTNNEIEKIKKEIKDEFNKIKDEFNKNKTELEIVENRCFMLSCIASFDSYLRYFITTTNDEKRNSYTVLQVGLSAIEYGLSANCFDLFEAHQCHLMALFTDDSPDIKHAHKIVLTQEYKTELRDQIKNINQIVQQKLDAINKTNNRRNIDELLRNIRILEGKIISCPELPPDEDKKEKL
ncbi:MAG: hypothetical protein LBQ28_03255 [Prevotellaceae bacterium]|jgi:hypothetical protein|nr:hypothetical protein [Prevotellaceae bacterium]